MLQKLILSLSLPLTLISIWPKNNCWLHDVQMTIFAKIANYAIAQLTEGEIYARDDELCQKLCNYMYLD